MCEGDGTLARNLLADGYCYGVHSLATQVLFD
jgi:hypothetical protein